MNTNTNNKNWQGYGEKKTLIQFLGMQMGATTMEKITEVFQKTNNKISI